MALVVLLVAGFVAAVAAPTRGGVTTRVSLASDGTQADYGGEAPSISADGRYVAFASAFSGYVPGDTGEYDVFVCDRQTATFQRVSVSERAFQVIRLVHDLAELPQPIHCLLLHVVRDDNLHAPIVGKRH